MHRKKEVKQEESAIEWTGKKLVVTKVVKFENGKASIIGNLTSKENTEEITFDVPYCSNSFFDNLEDKAINHILTIDLSQTI
ncbi:hypothetical protein [uncultured Draconibacterium sp.]|uniref:hypothetical protein n=1 Tax=uncultured Draconibacterium sp. TaxID=1573823 RepID=UPI0029C89C52|nr:hypothetical protein [uncultured Draconibacterium sp.]